MTREIGPVNDKVALPAAAPTGDAFQHYRMANLPSDTSKAPMSPISGDFMHIPPLHPTGDGSRHQAAPHPSGDGSSRLGPAHQSFNPGGAAGHEHMVQHKDSLWKLAEHSLGNTGHHSPGQVWHQVQNIIQANKHEHPELLKNPNMLHEGMKLHIPGQDTSATHAGDKPNNRQAHPAPDGSTPNNQRESQPPEPPTRPRPDANPAKTPTDTTAPKAPRDGADKPRADDNGRLGHALSDLGHGLAGIAGNVAQYLFHNAVAEHRKTTGDCAHGPRLAFGKLGFHMPPVVATEQGKIVKNSGLFDEVPRSQVRPGDYGVRDWSPQVIREHGYNSGDSFIVTNVAHNGQLSGANDHKFTVPEDGGRYRNLKFYRPNAEFVKRYGNV